MENNTLKDTRKLKICHVANVDFAVKFLLVPQLKFLQDQGYEIRVVCSPGKWVKDVEENGIEVKTINILRRISPLYDLITLYRLWNYFNKEKFDIVHTHTAKPALLGQLAARMARVPIVVNTIHGLYFHDDTPYFKRKFFMFLERMVALCSDLILSQNKEDITTLIKDKIASSEKVKYLGNGIDVNKFNIERFQKVFFDRKREELNIPVDFQIIGVVARLVEEKGYLDLFEAFRHILKIFPKTIILSIGPEEPEKKDAISPAIVKNYGIEKNVIFLGRRNDIDEIYPLMNVFVLPSYREGLPRSILEAMAEERAIVATDIRGCREEIENGKNGILVPVKNPEELAKSIIYFLKNPTAAKEMGENARIKVINEFDERLVFGRIKKEYDLLLNKKPGL